MRAAGRVCRRSALARLSTVYPSILPAPFSVPISAPSLYTTREFVASQMLWNLRTLIIQEQASAPTTYGSSTTAGTCCGYRQNIDRHALRCAGTESVWVLGLAECGPAVLTQTPSRVCLAKCRHEADAFCSRLSFRSPLLSGYKDVSSTEIA